MKLLILLLFMLNNIIPELILFNKNEELYTLKFSEGRKYIQFLKYKPVGNPPEMISDRPITVSRITYELDDKGIPELKIYPRNAPWPFVRLSPPYAQAPQETDSLDDKDLYSMLLLPCAKNGALTKNTMVYPKIQSGRKIKKHFK
jgi:hypothetical protein